MPTEEESVAILKERGGLSSSEIEKLVKDTIVRMKNLINRDTALYIILKERNLDVEDHKQQTSVEKDLKIKDIKEDSKNISVVGRITEVSSIHTFAKKDKTTGAFSYFWIKDDSGIIKVLLWDDRAKYVEQDGFAVNEIVRVLNGLVKKNRDGILEIHVSNKADIELNPSDVDYSSLPKIIKSESNETVEISKITIQMKNIALKGQVVIKDEIKEFKKPDKTIKILRMTIQDDSSSIPIVFWNEDIEKTHEIDEGDIIQIENVYAKSQYREKEKLELNSNKNTILKVIKKGSKSSSIQDNVTPIIELAGKEGLYSLEGEITHVDDIKEIPFKDGSTGALLSIIISDNTGAIRVTFWREQAEENSNLKVGDKIKLSKVLIKSNSYSNQNEATFRKGSILTNNINIKINKIHELPETKRSSGVGGSPQGFSHSYTSIKEIKSEGYFEIKGFVANRQINRITIYEACAQCNKKADNCTCQGGPAKLEYRQILNLLFDDGTDNIRASFIGKQADKILQLDATDVKIKLDGDNSEEFMQSITSKLVGKDYILKGRARFSDYSEQYEIIVSDFVELDYTEESERIIKEIS